VVATTTGRRARCRVCGIIFRVVEKLTPPPTEDDILDWLCEAEDLDATATERSLNAADAYPSCPRWKSF